MNWITLRIKDDVFEYQQPGNVIAVSEDKETEALELSEWKQAGRVDHPLTLKFLQEILKHEEDRSSGNSET